MNYIPFVSLFLVPITSDGGCENSVRAGDCSIIGTASCVASLCIHNVFPRNWGLFLTRGVVGWAINCPFIRSSAVDFGSSDSHVATVYDDHVVRIVNVVVG